MLVAFASEMLISPAKGPLAKSGWAHSDLDSTPNQESIAAALCEGSAAKGIGPLFYAH